MSLRLSFLGQAMPLRFPSVINDFSKVFATFYATSSRALGLPRLLLLFILLLLLLPLLWLLFLLLLLLLLFLAYC